MDRTYEVTSGVQGAVFEIRSELVHKPFAMSLSDEAHL